MPSDRRFDEPSPENTDSFTAMLAALRANGDTWTGISTIVPPAAQASTYPFYVVENSVVVALCEIRHPLTPQLERIGGNIGYAVHPEFRGRGIATFAMREALARLAALGAPQALITCAETNAASIRVIEKCNGVRIENSSRRRYVIAL